MDFANYWFSSGAGGGGYEIGNSLRFRPSSGIYMSNSVNSAPTTSTAATISFWLKRGRFNGGFKIFDSRDGSTDWGFNAFIPYNPGFAWGDSTFGSAENATGVTNYWTLNQYPSQPALRDFSAWYHIVLQWDSNNGTSTKRQRIWVNGVEYDFYNYFGSIGSGRSCPWTRNGYTFKIGDGSSPDFIIAEAHCVDGQVLNPTNFAEYNSDNVWVPKSVTGVTYGNNGWYLDFSDPANIGTDRSGSGNNFTATGFELSNTNSTNYDWFEDSPTNNYPTINPLYNYESPMGLSEANLRVDTNSGTNIQALTNAVREGQYYAEIYCDTSNTVPFKLGIIDIQGNRPSHFEQNSYTLMFQGDSGTYHITNGSFNQTTSSSQSWGNGDLIGLALDADNSICRIYKNGTLINTINFSSYITPGSTYLTMWHGYAAGSGAAVAYFNAGQRPFAQSVPTGYSPLASADSPNVDVANSGEHFQCTYWTGNSSARTIDLGMQPDMVWIKACAVNGADHVVVDSSRGATKVLRPNTNAVEYTQSDSLTAFVSNGIQLGSDTSGGPSGNFNLNGRVYSCWAWKKGTGVFDIVTYTGNGTGQTINHNLGAVPAYAIVKQINATNTWWVWSQVLGNNLNANNGMLDLTSGGSGLYTDDVFKGFTSTQFQIGADHGSNESGRNYVMYLWAEVPGFSSFHDYRGNQNANGVFYYCGFRPAWVMVRARNGTSNWTIWDRLGQGENTQNPVKKSIAANGSSSWQPDFQIDFLSNGFKLRTADTQPNYSGYDYMVAAFAEHPFGGGNISPSPAR